MNASPSESTTRSSTFQCFRLCQKSSRSRPAFAVACAAPAFVIEYVHLHLPPHLRILLLRKKSGTPHLPPHLMYAAPAPVVINAAPTPVTEYVAPAPADTHATPAQVISPVIEHIAPAPSLTVAPPSQQLPPAHTKAAVTIGASLDTTGSVNPPCLITAVEASAPQVVGSVLPLYESAAPVCNQVREEQVDCIAPEPAVSCTALAPAPSRIPASAFQVGDAGYMTSLVTATAKSSDSAMGSASTRSAWRARTRTPLIGQLDLGSSPNVSAKTAIALATVIQDRIQQRTLKQIADIPILG